MVSFFKKVCLLGIISLAACTSSEQVNQAQLSEEINTLINQWHLDAANANLEDYIGLMDSTCNYIGTDATENWLRDSFASFCKPYFDKGTTWDFTPLQRSVQINSTGNTAWFDEILDTHMGTCRGSGALEKIEGHWKLKQYVLSVAIPNESMNEVKKVKHNADSAFQAHFLAKKN